MYGSPATPMETALRGGEGGELMCAGGGGRWNKTPRKGRGPKFVCA